MAAARAWVAGQLDADQPIAIEEPEAIADARRWGAGADEIAGLRQHLLAPGAGGVAVWRSNAPAVAAFLVAGTQWRTALDVVDGRVRMVWIGLDYAGAKISIEQSGMVLTADNWTGVRIIEAAARDALNGDVVH